MGLDIMLPTLLFSLQQNCTEAVMLSQQTLVLGLESPCFMSRLDMCLHTHLHAKLWLSWVMLIHL